MSTLLESLTNQLGDNELGQLTGLLGADRERTQAAIPAGIATLLGGLAANASNSRGAESLYGALERDHDGGLLDNLAAFLGGGGEPQIGEKILGHILGGRRAGVVRSLSESTGLDSQAIGRLLATLAPLVLAQLGKTRRKQSLDPSGLAGILNQERTQLRRRPPNNLGPLAALLDQDGDGSVVDDLTRTGGGLLSKLFGRR